MRGRGRLGDEKARVRVRAVGRALAGGKLAGNALDLLRRARFIDEVPVFSSRALRRGRARRVGQNAANQRPPSHLFASYGLPRVVSELSDSQE